MFRHAKKLRLLSKKVAADFEVEDIHRFRVEVKKLRALVRFACPDGRRLPKRLRRIYKAVGEIRNLQLLRQSLVKAADPVLPEEFYRQLDGRIIAAKQETRRLLEEYGRMGKLARRLIAGVVALRLTGEVQRSFVRKRIAPEDRPGQMPGSDDALHNLRKSLKDLLYVWPFLGNGARKQAAAYFGGYPAMQKKARLLGDYLDIVFQLRLLQDKVLFPEDRFAGDVDKIIDRWHGRQEKLRCLIGQDSLHLSDSSCR
jgi:CHAD domain-containing protein